MNVEIQPGQEQIIARAIQAGIIHTADEVLEAGVEAIRARLDTHVDAKAPESPEAWARELHQWIHSHSTATPPLTDHAISRDSIYDTRGE